MKEGTIGLLMALNGLLIVGIEMVLVYELEKRKRSKTGLIMTGVTLTSIAYLLLAVIGWAGLSTMTIAVFFILFVTISEMLAIPFIQSFTVQRSSPATRGQYLALSSMSGALAQTTAPAFGSQMVAHFGFSVHWLSVSAIGLLAAGGFWFLKRRLDAPEPETLSAEK